MASSESFQLPTLKQLIAHQSHKHSNINGENDSSQLSLPPLPLISPQGFFKDEEKEKTVDIPIQILDNDQFQDPNKHLLLRVPKKNLNKTILHTVLKIRVIDPKILEKNENSELEDETNLVTNDLLLKEVKALRERKIYENEKLIELERSAATYRGRRPRIDSNFGESSSIPQDSMSSMTIMEESLNIERNRRRRIRPNSSQGTTEAVSHKSQTKTDGRKHLDTTTATISITTSRGSTLPDSPITDYPRGFFLTKSTDETLNRETFVGPQTESSQDTEKISFNVETISSNDEKLSSSNVKESFGSEIDSNNETITFNDEIPSDDGKLSSDNGKNSFGFDKDFNDETFNAEISSDDGKLSSDNEKESFDFVTTSDDKAISSNVEKIPPNVKSSEIIPSNVETIFSNGGNNEEIFSTTEKVFLNIEKEFPIDGKIIPTDETVTFSFDEITSVDFDFNRDSLLENKDHQNDEINFSANTGVIDNSGDHFDYNRNQQNEMNFYLMDSRVSEKSEDSTKTTTEVSESKLTTFEDINVTPSTVTEQIISPRRHLRKKIRKIKPIPKEPSEDFNSPKEIRLKKINDKFSIKDSDSSRNFESDSESYSEIPEIISTYPDVHSINHDSSTVETDLESISPDYEIDTTIINSESSTVNSATTFPILDSTSAITIDSTIINSYYESLTPTTESFKNKMSERDNENLQLETVTPIVLDSKTNWNEFEKESVKYEKGNITLKTKNLRRNEVTTEKDKTIQNQYLNTDPTKDQNETPTIVTSIRSDIVLKSNDNQQLEKEFTNNKTTTDETIFKEQKPTLNGRRRVIKRKRIGPNEEKLKVKNEEITTIENKLKLETIETNSRSEDKSKLKIIKTTLNKSEHIASNLASPPSTRKRVVVYRGAKRFSTVTTPSTLTSTTTVQSFSNSSVNHQNQIPSRRRMRTVVRKRAKHQSHDTSNDESNNRKGKSLNQEMKIVEDTEEAGSEVNTYRTSSSSSSSSDNLRRTGSFYREPNRSRVRTTTHQPISSLHPSLRRFTSTSPTRQNLHTKEINLPTQLSFASADDAETAAAYLEHLARLEDQKAEMDDQANRAHELVLENFETTTESGNSPIGTTFWRKISTTELPKTVSIPALRRRQGQKYFNKIVTQNLTQRPRRPAIIDYDYYEDEEIRFVGKPRLNGKLYVTSRGHINCLDQGNFPHPTSCKKFITCARMVNGLVVGTEYTCPNKLSFDPIGGICNWSAGLGCKE